MVLRLAMLVLLLAAAAAAQNVLELSAYRQKVQSLLDSPRLQSAFAHIESEREAILREWITVTSINAPSGHEQERAAYVEKLARAYGLNVSYDSGKNLVAVRKGTGGGPTVILDAHLDTVFQPGLQIKPEMREGRIYAPGVGDNTRNVVALLAIMRALNAADVRTRGDLVFLFTTEEETALGGAKKYVAENKANIGHYIALDGGYSGFTYGGIGINNYRVHFIGPGGHTRSRTPPFSATLPMSRAIARIYELPVPTDPPSHLNIGMLSGSEVINAKAATAWFSVDLRSTDQKVIDALESQMETIAREEAAREKMTTRTEVISRLPAAQIPEHRNSEIVRVAEAVHLAMGFKNPPITPTASNNANVALLAGLSAISTGVGPCGDSHALTEWCEIEPIYRGTKKVLLLATALAGLE